MDKILRHIILFVIEGAFMGIQQQWEICDKKIILTHFLV
jgi:hypothetical protein